MTTKVLKKDSIDLDEALYHLLHGEGLRKLARRYGVAHTYMGSLLQAKYGKEITNPSVTSLARSLISDYQGCTKSYQYALSVVKTGSKTEKFWSNRAVSAATKWITLDEPDLLNVIAVYQEPDDSYETWGYLRWYYLYYTLNHLVVDLGSLYYSEVGKAIAQDILENWRFTDGVTQAS
jgi:hypothetical protein